MKEKTTRIFLFLILFMLFCFTPVIGLSPTLKLINEKTLPLINPNGNQTPLIHIANNGKLITLNYQYDPNFFVYNRNGSILWNVTLSAEQSPWISSVNIAPDGQNIIVAQLVPACCHGSVTNTSSNKVILFDRTGGKSWEYPTFSPPLTSTISNDNQNIFIGTEDGRIISLNRDGTSRWITDVDAPVLSLTISADNSTIVATGESNYYSNKLYGERLNPHDLFVLSKNGTLLWKYQTRGTNTAAVSDDGSLIAVLNERSGNVLLFNRTGSQLIEKSFTGTPSAIAMSGDGNLIVVRTLDGFVYGVDHERSVVWNASIESESQGIAISDDGNRVILGDGRIIAIYNKTGYREEEYPVDSRVRSIGISPDRESVIIGTEQKLIVFSVTAPVLSTESTALTPIQTMQPSMQIPQTPMKAQVSSNTALPVWSDRLGEFKVLVACSDDGSSVIAGSDSGLLKMYDTTGKMIWEYSTNGTSFTSVSISGNGEIISGATEGSVLVFDHNGKRLLNFNSTTSITRSAVSRNGETIISSRDNGLKMFDSKGEILGNKVQPGAIWDVAISDDGKYGAAAVDLGWQTRKGKIVVIDRNGSSVLDYPTLSQGVGIGISSDGSSIVGIDDYNLYSVFRNGTLRWSFPSSPPFWDVTITPDGRYVVAGSQYYLRVFNETGSLLWQNQESEYVSSVAVSENGEYIIAGSFDQVRLFDKSGNLLWHYNQGASNVAASKNGEYFAVGTNDEIKYFNKWGNGTFIDGPNTPVKSSYPSNSSSVAIPLTPKPAPLSSMVVIGALFCISVVASFSKKFKSNNFFT